MPIRRGSGMRRAGSVAKRRVPGPILICALAFWLAGIGLSQAQDAAAEQQRLYNLMALEPTNYQVTFAFVEVATARGDYEAAIGALERILYYNPDLPAVRYELGSLYYRLGVYEMANRYFREALASPDLDPATKARIEAYLPNADKQMQQSRLSGFIQTGLRYQSNANLEPVSGTVRIEGRDFELPPTKGGKSDVNWFGLASLSHDYDLQDQRGDTTLETRFTGYLTQQFRLHDLDVGLLDASVGPRLALAPELLPGATLKPYLLGGNSWVDGVQYLSSVGAGLSLDLPAPGDATFEPTFEWRRVIFATSAPALSEYGTGDWLTVGLASSFAISEQAAIEARTYYRRGEAGQNFQAFNQWGVEGALAFQFAPPSASIPQSWTISPFARLIATSFDAPNPFIDRHAAHADTEWIAGLAFDTPMTGTFGLSTAIQYDCTHSTLANYRLNNLSIISGPTIRF